MKKKLNCILLIDDREDCNYMHKMVIEDMACAETIKIANNGKEAIEYLKTIKNGSLPKPELIFLDLNMPVMDGWEFLEEYDKLSDEQKAGEVLIMLTTSLNPKDLERASENKYVKDYMTKFLDEESLLAIIEKYYPEHL